MFNNAFKNKNVLVTGHTGFKGSWICLWLKSLGANIHGVSDKTYSDDSHWLGLSLGISEEFFDIADFEKVKLSIEKFKPDIIFHLAAQSLVRKSYREPYQTLQTNVLGTMNVLESVRISDSAIACLIVTSDKCYENQEWIWGYRETEPLGGKDVYSASKAMCEILTHSYQESFLKNLNAHSALIATARAGNVIGGGDWSEDRLVPDIARSILKGKYLDIRNPNATRPWQHVLDCLQGYLVLGSNLLSGNKIAAGAWNFGPSESSNIPVKDLILALREYGLDSRTVFKSDYAMPEANNLFLDSAKARKYLKWKPIWNFNKTVRMTASWYNLFINENLISTSHQLQEYIEDAEAIKADFTADD